jgi:hypothetical protein
MSQVQNPSLSTGKPKKKTLWDWLTNIIDLANYVALTAVISIFAVENFVSAGVGNLPSWFGNYVYVIGVDFLLITGMVKVVHAIFSISIFAYALKNNNGNKEKNILELVSALINFFGSGTVGAGSILLATGVAAANPVAALAVSVLFMVTFISIAANAIFRVVYNERNRGALGLTQKEIDILRLNCGFACAISALGIFALIAKLVVASALITAIGWGAAGVSGLLLIIVTFVSWWVQRQSQVIRGANLTQPQSGMQPEQQTILPPVAQNPAPRIELTKEMQALADEIQYSYQLSGYRKWFLIPIRLLQSPEEGGINKIKGFMKCYKKLFCNFSHSSGWDEIVAKFDMEDPTALPLLKLFLERAHIVSEQANVPSVTSSASSPTKTT